MKSAGMATLLASTMAISGCEYVRVLSFTPDAASGVTGERRARIALTGTEAAAVVGGEEFDAAFATLPEGHLGPEARERYAKAGADMAAAIEKHCVVTQTESFKASGVATTIAVFAAGQIVSFVADRLKSRVDALAARSKENYAASLIIEDPESFGRGEATGPSRKGQCVVLLRNHGAGSATAGRTGGGEGEVERTTFAHVVKITPVGSAAGALEVRPVYNWLGEAVAETAAGDGLALGFTLAVKATRPKGQAFETEEFALASYSIAGVKPGDPARTDDLLPQRTKLVSRPPQDATALELVFSVSEQGSGAPDADAAKAEIDAFFEAVGPIVEQRVTGIFAKGGDDAQE